MKQSNIPLSTGRPTVNDQTSTSATDLKTIIDNFKEASAQAGKETRGATTTKKGVKPTRYNAEHVKNKQSHIPFAKFRQPNYIEYNRYGTITGMQQAHQKQQDGSALKKTLDDRNEQSRLFKKTLMKANYKIGYSEVPKKKQKES